MNRIKFLNLLAISMLGITFGSIGLEKPSTPATDPELIRIQKTLDELHVHRDAAIKSLGSKRKQITHTEKKLNNKLKALHKIMGNKAVISADELKKANQLLKDIEILENEVEQETQEIKA